MDDLIRTADASYAPIALPSGYVNGKLVASPDELSKMGFGGRTKIFESIANGTLRAFKVGRSTRVLVSDAVAWLTANPVKPRLRDRQAEAA